MPIDEKEEVLAKAAPAHFPDLGSRAVAQRKSSSRNWLLLLLALVGAGWFLWPRCSHRMLRKPVTLQDRVHNILTKTPLIGESKQLDRLCCS